MKTKKTRTTKQSKLKKINKLSLRSKQFLLVIPIFVVVGTLALWRTSAAPSCVQKAPDVRAENNYSWGQWGSWGLPGQKLRFLVEVTNNDIGCQASSFAVSTSSPSGFATTFPQNDITLKSNTSGLLSAYVTSPTTASDGDYPLLFTVQRDVPNAQTASYTTYYKLYSSDTVAPTLYWSNPSDGQVISGHSYQVIVSSNDDHAVKHIDAYLDNTYVTSATCDDISYVCQLYYPWALHGVRSGSHTIIFKSYDWVGNVGTLPVTFTVQ